MDWVIYKTGNENYMMANDTKFETIKILVLGFYITFGCTDTLFRRYSFFGDDPEEEA
jgi:hypothetical protein